ncbi:hypothetical protein [Robertkochia solimangrovi]|uniref:hypothetical protein n=1 Tax=Robertkochia solimangrovi TaxID=2213046 RepID=UPI0011811534|nr:hypothetical protein [Robertkochia solimangrovi]TRZ42171.1 hypothetical protein DMZ48_14150 [Robertkochia solimangrovi]
MIKKILIGILLLGIITIIGFFIFMANFEIFDAPVETELKTECDYEGLRKIIMSESGGNAVTRTSIHISVTDCKYDKEPNEEFIFVVDAPNIKPKDVSFSWKTFDTVTIRYDKKLRIFKQESESKTVNPKIIFEYITK